MYNPRNEETGDFAFWVGIDGLWANDTCFDRTNDASEPS